MSFNNIEGPLPDIDRPLQALYAQGNRITKLGNLPQSLEKLNLSENPLQSAGNLCDKRLDACEMRNTGLNMDECGACVLR